MLARVAKEAKRTARTEAHRVATGNTVEIFDLPCITVVSGVEQELANPRQPLETVEAIAIERNVEAVRIALHGGLPRTPLLRETHWDEDIAVSAAGAYRRDAAIAASGAAQAVDAGAGKRSPHGL
jgi:hypothetical protein